METQSKSSIKSQRDFFETYLPFIGGSVLGLGIFIYFYFVAFLWLICGISLIAALIFGSIGATSKPGEDRNALFLVAGVAAAISLGSFVWVRQYSPNNDAQYSGNMANHDPKEIKKFATLRYWDSIIQIDQSSNSQPESRKELSQLLKASATRIESLPTLNVDPILVIWSLEAAASLREFGQAIDELIIEDERNLVRSFWNGFSGNIVGIIEDLTQSETPGAREVRLSGNRVVRIWEQQGALVRAKLTEKYETNFPPLGQ